MAAIQMDPSWINFILNELSRPMDASYLDHAASVMTAAHASPESNTMLGTVRIENYVEKTVPLYSDPLFKAHFRMSRSSFQELLELVGPHTNVRTISLERRTLACLWYLSNQETFRSVVDRFGLSKGSLHYFLMNFCRTMTSAEIMKPLISWPNSSEYAAIAERNSVRSGFPGVVGMIDGSYIPIPGPGPQAFREVYICRKGYPAMHLQAVCTSNLQFTDVYCAYPGSVHDARVFKQSPLHDMLTDSPLPESFHLLGDSAYPLSPSVLVPFRDNGHLSHEEKIFNCAHSSTRVVIERSFGLLKGKFRKLKYLDMRNVREIPYVVITCCVLHNFILDKESFTGDEIEMEDGDEIQMEDPSCTSSRDVKSGVQKRLEIAQLLA